MSETNSIQDVSVVDVYDLASEIGKECEKIIDAYGTESVQVGIVKKLKRNSWEKVLKYFIQKKFKKR